MNANWFLCVNLAKADAEDKGRLAGMISTDDCASYRKAGDRHSRSECVGCEQWLDVEAGHGLLTAREMFAGSTEDGRPGAVLRDRVLRFLADGKVRTPTEIARAIEVSPTRVGQILRELLERGEVVHIGLGQWAGATAAQQIASAETRWGERFNEVSDA